MRSALRLIWALDIRHMVLHRLRLALSAVGIASGVGLAIGVGALSSSITASLEGVATAAASTANVEVRPNAPVGLPYEMVAEVRAIPGIDKAGGTVESYTRMRSGTADVRTLLLGIDTGIFELSPRAIDERSFSDADPTGLFLPASLAKTLGVRRGDRIEVFTPRGWTGIHVGTVLPEKATGAGRAVVGGITVVQQLVGRPGRVDAIYAEASGDPAAAIAVVQKALGPRARAGQVGVRQKEFEQILQSTAAALNTATLVALFVGAFLIYNTMSMAAVERTGEAALLRAVGARRRQVFALFVAEGGLLGAVGSALGVAGGAGLAAVALSRTPSLEAIGIPIEIAGLSLRARDVAVAAVAGVLVSVCAAILPARRISRAEPAPALGPAGALEDPLETGHRATTVAGSLMLACATALAVHFFVYDLLPVAFASLILFLGGVALLIRTTVPLIARTVFGPLSSDRARLPGVVRLAAGEVLRAPGRTAFTAGAVLLSLALIVAFSIAVGSFRRTFLKGFGEILRADLYVRSATWSPFGSDVPLDPEIADDLRSVPDVAIAYPFRGSTAVINDEPVLLIAFDHHGYTQLPDVTPERRRMTIEHARLLAEPGTVLINPALPRVLKLDVGDHIDMPTPSGARRLRIVGLIPEPSSVPTMFFEFEQFSALWGTHTADLFQIGVTPGADPAGVKREIERRFGRTLGLQVDTRKQYQDRVNAIVYSFGQMVGAVMLVAVLVSGLGLANTLLISTLERRRDLGVLRAVGMLRRQIRRMVAVEALLVGALGVVLAWFLGTAMGLFIFQLVEAQVGQRMLLTLAPSGYIISGALGIAGAAVAALYPAHRASRVDVVEALHYE